jgi:hypothetical protein
MRGWMSLTLGTWHIYKHMTFAVWRHYRERWLGPLFNELIPASNCVAKPTLSATVGFLSYVRIAYPSFRSQLHAAIGECEGIVGADNRMKMLSDLQVLCEYIIPAVSYFH